VQITSRPLAGIDLDKVTAELAELWAATPRLEGIPPAVVTLENLVNAVLAHANFCVPALRTVAGDAKLNAERAVYNAQRVLYETSGPTSASDIALQIQGAEAQINANNRIINIDAEIAKATAKCERLARGHDANEDGVMRFPGGSLSPKSPAPVLYRQARRELDTLRIQAQGKDQAIRDNEALARKLAELRAQSVKALEERLDPRNMVWSQ
jgi:hypothetical protein